MAADRAAEFFGRALAAARSERGMKRMDLKAKSRLSYPYIAEIENGGKYPSQQAIQKLADAVGMSPSELMARAEQIQSAECEGIPQISTEAVRSAIGPEVTFERLPLPSASAIDDPDVVARLTDQVLRAIEPRVRDMLEREISITVREELLRQREGRHQ